MVTTAAFGVIIPARFASTRLPGKPLLDLAGKPMVVRVMELAARAGASFTLVATDDRRIEAAVREAGGEAVMTSSHHRNGTERLAEVTRIKGLEPETIIVNLQGDEPLLPPVLVGRVAQLLTQLPRTELSTLATPVKMRSELFDPNVVKVVCDSAGKALYFSRAPIPWQRDELSHEAGPSQPEAPAGMALRHIGLYAYRVSTLHALSEAAPAPLELAEGLEQLRALCLGMSIRVGVVDGLPAGSIDTADDAERVARYFESNANATG